MKSADFVRVLKTPARARSAHFALHHLQAAPSRPKAAEVAARTDGFAELSTGTPLTASPLVDESDSKASAGATPAADVGLWLGCVVPKRHAKRAVTRTALKRQIDAAMERVGVVMEQGLWVLRLHSPFDRKIYKSATSAALRMAARQELDKVFASASGPARRRR